MTRARIRCRNKLRRRRELDPRIYRKDYRRLYEGGSKTELSCGKALASTRITYVDHAVAYLDIHAWVRAGAGRRRSGRTRRSRSPTYRSPRTHLRECGRWRHACAHECHEAQQRPPQSTHSHRRFPTPDALYDRHGGRPAPGKRRTARTQIRKLPLGKAMRMRSYADPLLRIRRARCAIITQPWMVPGD